MAAWLDKGRRERKERGERKKRKKKGSRTEEARDGGIEDTLDSTNGLNKADLNKNRSDATRQDKEVLHTTEHRLMFIFHLK